MVWRNDELTDPPGERPESFGGEHRQQSRVIECDPPRRLAFTWDGDSDVTIELEPRGNQVLLTLVHRHRSEEHTSETPVTNAHLVCRLLLEKKNSHPLFT